MSVDSYPYLRAEGVPDGPLLLVFHGTGGDEHQLVALGQQAAPTATIVSPRGDVSEYGSARFFRRTGEGVYDMDDLARATEKMIAFVRAHVASAKPGKVFGLGYSNGANILASSLFSAPDLFDAVVLMHPLIPFEPNVVGSLAGKRVLVTAGRRDPICPVNLTARLDSYLRADGADVTLDWHEGGHELRPGEVEAARLFFAATTESKMSEVDIRLNETDTKGRYWVKGAGSEEAEMTYSKVGDDMIIIDHTLVPDARAAGKRIIPLCPFAAAQFKRHPEWADVLKS